MPQLTPASVPADFVPVRLEAVCTPGAFTPAERERAKSVVIGAVDVAPVDIPAERWAKTEPVRTAELIRGAESESVSEDRR
jgi:hypothetical protein